MLSVFESDTRAAPKESPDGRGSLDLQLHLGTNSRTRPGAAVKWAFIGAGIFATLILLGYGIARFNNWYQPYGSGSIRESGRAAEMAANAPLCDLEPSPLPVERIQETKSCDPTGLEILFPNGAKVRASTGVAANVGEDYEAKFIGLVNQGGVAILQTETSVTYWGTLEGIRLVQYHFGTPEPL